MELSRRLARSFNNRFCKKSNPIFPIPLPVLVGQEGTDEGAARVRSLRDPKKKMSKSDPDNKSCIYINDTSAVILEKCKKAVTDFTSTLSFDPIERQGVSNLISIHSAVTGLTPTEICKDCESLNTGKYKVHLANILIEHLTPIREYSEHLLNNKEHLESILRSGEDAARNIAQETMHDVSKVIGLK